MEGARSEGVGRSVTASVTRDSLPSSTAVLSATVSLCWKLCLILAISCLLPVGATTVVQKKKYVDVPLKKWECGSGEYSKWFSHSSVHATCPVHAADINHCCVIHDDCYVRQRGQEMCDEEFRQCNLKAAAEDPTDSCKGMIAFTNLILFYMGESAYNASLNHVDPPEAMQNLCRRSDTLGTSFDYMYSACPTTRPIVSSCCELFAYCPSHAFNYSNGQCLDRLANCLTESAAIESADSCNRSLARSKDLIYNFVQQPAHLKKEVSNTVFVLLLVISVGCAFGLLYTTYKYNRLRTFTRSQKYQTIIDLNEKV